MSDQDKIERDRRIRDQQLRRRDPKARDRRTLQRISASYRRKRKQITLQDVLKDIPGKWWGMILGGIIGTIGALVLGAQIEASWEEYLA